MFLLQRQREPIDNAAQDLQQLRNAIMMLRLVDKAVKHVVDLFPDKGAQAQELSINPMQHRLQEVPFARVFRIEQVQQVQHELVVDVTFRNGRLEVGRLQEPQKQVIDKLQMRPGRFQRRLIFLRIEFSTIRIRRGGQRSE